MYVPARIKNTYTDTQLASKPCLVKSIDYTSKGDADKIEIMIGEQKFMIEKKFVTDVKLNETGVYNSETDKENNPKTGENKPDELTGMVSKLIDSVAGVIGSLEDIKDMVEENSSLSYTALETCIAELQSYVKSLEDESDVSAQASAN